MGRKSAVDRLPDDIKAYLHGQLADGRMTLDELIADLKARWPEESEAGELPSRAAVGRYGQKLERRLSAIRASTEAAKIIQAQSGDREDARSGALTAMIQAELFESIMALQEAGDEEMPPSERVGLLSSAAKNIATLTRSSVNLKRWQAEVEERARKAAMAEAAAIAEQTAKQQGVSSVGIAALREAIMSAM